MLQKSINVLLLLSCVLSGQTGRDCCQEMRNLEGKTALDIEINLVGPDLRPVTSYRLVSFRDRSGGDFVKHFQGLNGSAIPVGVYTLRVSDLEIAPQPGKKFDGTFPVTIGWSIRTPVIYVGNPSAPTGDSILPELISGRIDPPPNFHSGKTWVKLLDLVDGYSGSVTVPALVQSDGSFCVVTGLFLEGTYLLVVIHDGVVLKAQQVYLEKITDERKKRFLTISMGQGPKELQRPVANRP